MGKTCSPKWIEVECIADIGGKKTPWSESASELYRPRDRRFSAK
jgi:hypothetical protein